MGESQGLYTVFGVLWYVVSGEQWQHVSMKFVPLLDLVQSSLGRAYRSPAFALSSHSLAFKY